MQASLSKCDRPHFLRDLRVHHHQRHEHLVAHAALAHSEELFGLNRAEAVDVIADLALKIEEGDHDGGGGGLASGVLKLLELKFVLLYCWTSLLAQASEA